MRYATVDGVQGFLRGFPALARRNDRVIYGHPIYFFIPAKACFAAATVRCTSSSL